MPEPVQSWIVHVRCWHCTALLSMNSLPSPRIDHRYFIFYTYMHTCPPVDAWNIKSIGVIIVTWQQFFFFSTIAFSAGIVNHGAFIFHVECALILGLNQDLHYIDLICIQILFTFNLPNAKSSQVHVDLFSIMVVSTFFFHFSAEDSL